MLYNERITTDASQGVKIYEGNQGQAMMKEGAAVKQQAAREMQQAKELEEKSYKLSMVKGMNELWQNEQLSSNPQALANEMDKLSEKVTSNISDMDMRVNVLTDFELKKDSYINKATTKMKRIQEEKARSAAFDAIYANIDSLSRAFGNGVSGNYNDGDVVNYQYSLDRIKANINARNPDGTYMFSDSQRRAMARQADTALREGFINSYAELPEEQQKEITQKLNDGTYTVANFGLKELSGESAFNDIKRDVTKYNREMLNEKIKERKYQGLVAIEEFQNSPSEAALEKLYELNPTMSDKTKDKYREVLENDPIYQEDQKTYYADYETAKSAVDEFVDMDFKSDDEKLANIADVINKINKSANKGKLEEEDVNGLKKLMLTAAMNKQVAQNIKRFNAYNTTFWDEVFTFPAYTHAKTRKELEDMALPLQRAVIDGLSNGESPEKMTEILKQSKRMFINFKYPDLDGKQIGDIINKRGITYKIVSLDPVPTLEPVE